MESMIETMGWWIACVEIPLISALFWMIWNAKQTQEESYRQVHAMLEARTAQLREALSSFKLEVARTYAQISDLRDLESRLTGHLLRIEAKLDQTALKAEGLKKADQ
jgi:hypothetical protein